MRNSLGLARGVAWTGAMATSAVVLGQELRPAPGFWMRLGGNFRAGYSVKFSDTAGPSPTAAGQFSNGFVLPSISG